MAFQLRTLIAPLLLGGTLIATSLPALADHDHRRYGSPKVEYHYHDYRGGKHHHRGKPKHVKKHHKHHKQTRVVEHHHYHAPPRARYYEPGVVVTVPPIIFKLN